MSAQSRTFINENLVLFISVPDGLNSSYDFYNPLGSIDGNKDILNIIDIVKKKEKY